MAERGIPAQVKKLNARVDDAEKAIGSLGGELDELEARHEERLAQIEQRLAALEARNVTER